jgi:hypothetical protein
MLKSDFTDTSTGVLAAGWPKVFWLFRASSGRSCGERSKNFPRMFHPLRRYTSRMRFSVQLLHVGNVHMMQRERRREQQTTGTGSRLPVSCRDSYEYCTTARTLYSYRTRYRYYCTGTCTVPVPVQCRYRSVSYDTDTDTDGRRLVFRLLLVRAKPRGSFETCCKNTWSHS